MAIQEALRDLKDDFKGLVESISKILVAKKMLERSEEIANRYSEQSIKMGGVLEKIRDIKDEAKKLQLQRQVTALSTESEKWRHKVLVERQTFESNRSKFEHWSARVQADLAKLRAEVYK